MTRNIQGVLVKREGKYNPFNWKSDRIVMTVRADGSGVQYYGTCPKPLRSVPIGSKVRFTAEVADSDVNLFKFIQRPRRAEVISDVK